jgi:general secretion pathway protein D
MYARSKGDLVNRILLPLILMIASSFSPLERLKDQEEGIEGALVDVNKDLVSLREELSGCYQEIALFQEKGLPEEEYKGLLGKVKDYRKALHSLEDEWRQRSVEESKKGEEGYSLWDQEETTLGQLIMEYGSLDFLYVVPPDMAGTKLNMHSQLPIPRESWTEVLEIILAHNGIGAKKINTYTKQLYFLKQDPSFVQVMASSPESLLSIPSQTRLFYVFSPPPEQAKGAFQFFEKFADAKQTFIHQVGTKIAIVSSKEEIEKLLNLHRTVWQDANGKVSRVVSVTKMPVKEMEKILVSFFGDAIEKNRPPFNKVDQEGLVVFPMGQGNSLVLIGQESIVDRAEKIVEDTEEQLQNPAEMVVHLYICRHSDPTDLAKVLEKVYSALLVSAMDVKESIDFSYSQQGLPFRTPDGYAPGPLNPVVTPPLNNSSTAQGEVESGTDHFVPDPKTGNLLMVVRKDVLPRIKSLLKQLDVPKKMVQIEVLLFEKILNNNDNFGLNLLRIGTNRNNVKYTSLFSPSGRGVLEYLYHKAKGKTPAMDFAYSFLMTQENIQFHAAPSLMTVNQTPSSINIVDEISINNGAAPIDTNKGVAFEQSYTRAQYGINITMTPTVHAPEASDDPSFQGKGAVTLQTNISFDTPVSSVDSRPLVHRRHIENEVRVIDGETVIIGGLRKKTIQDKTEKIPFLGEIPGIAKLFGSTELSDANTEMFFFITPHIIPDEQEALETMRTDELKKRPGDLPEFLQKVEEARQKENRKYFERSINLFFKR